MSRVEVTLRRESSKIMVGEAPCEFMLTEIVVPGDPRGEHVESVHVAGHCCWVGPLPAVTDPVPSISFPVDIGDTIKVVFDAVPKLAAACGSTEELEAAAARGRETETVRVGPIGHARKITSLGLGLWHIAAVDEDGLVWVRDERGESWVCLEPLPARPEGRGIFNEGLLGVRRAAQVACMSQDGLAWRVVVVDDEGVPWEWMRGPSRGWHMLSPLPSREAVP